MGTFAETAIIDYLYRLPTKENKLQFLFAANTNGSCHLLFMYMLKQQHINIQKTQHHIYMYMYICGHFKLKMENGSSGDFP
jgi:hypothetical protein